VNLEDLENTSGEKKEYWLVTVLAAREASSVVGNAKGPEPTAAKIWFAVDMEVCA
jgi:hypothetical protein